MFKFLQSFALLCAFALPAFAAQPVNVNTADAGAIAAALAGVGPAKAEAIVAYRTEHGPFKTVDDVAHVKGVGQKLVDRNRDLITIDGSAPTAKAETKAAGAKAESGG